MRVYRALEQTRAEAENKANLRSLREFVGRLVVTLVLSGIFILINNNIDSLKRDIYIYFFFFLVYQKLSEI